MVRPPSPPSWPLSLYRGATTLLEPAAAFLLLARARRGKEDPFRIDERRGFSAVPRPAGMLAWIHGASVGETISIMPVVERLVARGIAVVVTSGTVTSAQVLKRRLPPGAIHQFAPLDVPRYMRRFLDHWQPDIALVVESELWPNMIAETHRRGTPLILVNGRMSERSHRRWRRLPEASRALLSRFDLCLAQTGLDGHRFSDLGAPRVSVVGNLKFDVPAPPSDLSVLAQMSGLLAGRPVWMAASTHAGEDEIVLDAHDLMKERLPNLLTIIMPRHPERGERIADLAAVTGLKAARRSLGAAPERDVSVYVADTMGESGLFYRLAAVAFMGGSLVTHGGQNPIEPSKLGTAVLHGPHVANFAEIYTALDRAGGALPVSDAQTLASAATALLRDPARARALARAASEIVDSLSGAVQRTMQAVEPYILAFQLGRSR